ncbi:MAG: hypothetical protein QXW44_01465 [Pyrobaculum sp.]
MDTVFLLLSILAVSVAALGLVTYRLIKSLEVYLIPLYAELIRKRERDHILIEFLTSTLAAKGLITTTEANLLKNISTAGPVTVEELDRVNELLDKDPAQLSIEELLDLKKIAYKLLGRLDKKSIALGIKLLKYAARIEESISGGFSIINSRHTERVEMSYDHDTCTVYLTAYRKDGIVERTQGPDIDCVVEAAAVLKALARRKIDIKDPRAVDALRKYEICKKTLTAGCKALKEALEPLEKKSLDILLEKTEDSIGGS